MQPNPLKSAFAEGRPVLNGWLSAPSPLIAEILGGQGYDSLTVDLQHGMIDFSDALGMLSALRGTGAAPLVRAPWLDPNPIMKLLDAGAVGVICPMINSAEEAARLVSYVRFPPDGVRSFGPTRAAFSLGVGDASAANANVLCFAMVETAAGLAALDEILATPGLDGVYVGPADLTLGVTAGRLPPGFDREEPEMVEIIQRIAAAARRAGKMAALHCGSPAYAARAVGWGFHMVTLLNDVRLIATAAADSVTATRAALKDRTA